MKYIFTLMLFLMVSVASAVPDIAITNLLLLHNKPNTFNLKASESGVIAYNSPRIESAILAQNNQFHDRLTNLIAESGVFTVSNGESIEAIWLMSDPKILSTLYVDQEPDIESNISESAIKNKQESGNSAVKVMKIATNSQKYVLLGWVTKISETELKQPIPGTTKTSAQYSVSIRVKYKLVDRDSQKIIGQFLANGRTGIAQILPSANYPTSYDTMRLVHIALKSLASNVEHELLLARQNGLFNPVVVKNAPAK